MDVFVFFFRPRLPTNYADLQTDLSHCMVHRSEHTFFIAHMIGKSSCCTFQAIFALVILMEYKLQVLGHKAEEDRIWTLILEARSLVNKTHQTKQVFSI